MADGKKDQPKPTWTERSVPEVVRPQAPAKPSVAEDWGEMVPASDNVVASAYGRTGHLPIRPNMNRGEQAADELYIQKSAKAARVLNFVVEGIHWRAGFAPEIAQTPLNQYVRDGRPPEGVMQAGNGFLMRPSEPEFDRVLRDIVPPQLLKLEEEMFGRGRELVGLYLYYMPHGAEATAGAIAWYDGTATGRAHLVYLQTEVRRPDPRILDEMEKTFSASLVAVRHQGPVVRPFDFWQELRDATTEVKATLKNSQLSSTAEGVRDLVASARGNAETRLAGGIEGAIAKGVHYGEVAFVRFPQFALARILRGVSAFAVRVIRTIDGYLAKRQPDPYDDLPRP